ncbi:uncharacterized protein LOC129607803 [Condylostylus longicornis]|uniref:uncharacterized protein LOC129607803 n=1 Tax=Condylostylus longicornis TaxID=2530218 RepID=UPI00244DA844|nr:uncharacterized protein LOC129607803 [Condylostylus longicornis]
MGKGHDDNIINSDQEDLVGLTSSSEMEDDDGDDDLSDDCDGTNLVNTNSNNLLNGHSHHHHHHHHNSLQHHNHHHYHQHSNDGNDNCFNNNGRSSSDTMQFSLCKTNANSLSLIDTTTTEWNSTTEKEYQNAQQHHQMQLQHFRKCKRIFLLLIAFGFGLLLTSFSLFIVLPLYQKQLEIGRKTNNSYGSILFISPIITFLLILLTQIFSWLFKWTIQVYKFPVMPIKRLLAISLCCGIAGTLCTVSSYKRVPCHLQDPLKGAALVYSLVFYFFFCKKVMGLQKIFSATTAVVGLFISVDYGLCDEFRCHGQDTSNGFGGGSLLNQLEVADQKIPHTTGWQGRAFWTLLYVIGLILWTLHLSLLEGNLVMLTSNPSNPPPNNLLKTISRLVSNSDRHLDERPLDRANSSSQNPKQRPKPLHIAAWIHIISLLTLLVFGSIDVFPSSGEIKPFARHWIDTGNTFICHLGIEPQEDINLRVARRHKTLEHLTNLTPGSILYNQTVQKLRRDKRNTNINNNSKDNIKIDTTATTNDINIKDIKGYNNNDIKSDNRNNMEENYNKHNNNNNNKNRSNSNNIIITSDPNINNNSDGSSNINGGGNSNNYNDDTIDDDGLNMNENFHGARSNNLENRHLKLFHRRLGHHFYESEHLSIHELNHSLHHGYFKSKYRNITSTQTPLISRLIIHSDNEEDRVDCGRVASYSWLLIANYIAFIIFLFYFLDYSESAVFSIAVITSALPFIGLFWSMFRLEHLNGTAFLTWAPSISGELICSLLGAPIVFLGLILLYRAHFGDMVRPPSRKSSSNPYRSLSEA